MLRIGFWTKLENTMFYIRALGILHNLAQCLNDPLPDEAPIDDPTEEDQYEDEGENQQDHSANDAVARVLGKLHREAVFNSIFGNN